MKRVTTAFLSAGIFLCLFLYMFLPPASWAQDNQQKKAFILHSYHRSLFWDDTIDRTIESTFRESDQNIKIQIEYMDTKRIFNPAYLEQLRKIYKHKFRNQKFDVIICVDNNALNFLIKHRDEIFPKTPVVFCGVNNFHDSMLENTSLYTGVVEAIEVKGTIDIALRLHPETKQIIIYGTDTPTYFANKKIVKKVMSLYEGSVDVRFIEGLNIKEVQDNVQKLSDDSIVLLIASLTNEKGQRIFFRQFAEMVDRVSRVPQYSFWDFILGYGIIGGKLISGVAQGETAAKMALHILNGEKVENVHIFKQSPNRYMFDYKHLKRFGIKLSDLPPKIVLINKPSSFYSQYKGMVWTVIIILFSLLSLITVLVISIAKSRRFEEALQKSEKKYRNLIDNSSDLSYRTDIEGKIIFISKAVHVLSGYTVEEAIGMNMAKEIYVKPVERDNFLTILQRDSYVTNFEAQLKHKDGSIWWASTNAHFYKDTDGNILGVEGVTRDVTEKKLAEIALYKETKFTETALNSQQDTFFLFDPATGKAIRWNQAFNDISGYTNKEISEIKAPNSYYSSGDLERAAILINDVLKTGVGRIELDLICKDGSKVPTEYNVSVVKDDTGKPEYFISIGRDITNRRKAEQEKTKAQKVAAEQKKMALVGQIAGKMAHDFNNVLAVIMGNAQLALLDSKEAETIKTLELIFNQTIRGKNLTRNLVAFAKDQEPKHEFFRLSEKIDLVLNLLKRDLEGIEIIKEEKSGLPEVLADPGMMEHGFVNLIQNSIHALSTAKHPKITIRTYKLENNLCLEIEDNGCGIPKEHLENIYAPSFTLKGSEDVTQSYKNGIKGTGYGMANVKKYIEQHKGSVFVESKLGFGTNVDRLIVLA